jgi:hypothetical protein
MAPAKKVTQRPARTTAGKASKGFTDDEKAAVRERAQELKASAGKADGESDVVAKIAETAADEARIAALVKQAVS